MKKFGYAVFAIFVFGIICFFIFPEPTTEEINSTIATTTQPTTSETTTTEPMTTELTTVARARINTREKAATTKVVETTEKRVETSTLRSIENTTKSVEKTTNPKVTTTKAQTTTKKVMTTKAQTTQKNVEPITSNKNYTDYDVKLLAQIIYCEASGTSRDEMAKVGQVVLNRRDTTYFEFANCKTIYSVIAQDGQYPETLEKIENGIKLSNSIDKAEMEKAMKIAEGLLNGTIDSGLSKDVLWQTGFIPTWNVDVVDQTDWHYYSKLAN